MYVSVHIYKHLALFFFVAAVRFFSPHFTLTLLDHVVLVSSASTTNTREIKNRFRPEPVDRPERAIVCVEKKNPGGTAPKLHKNCQNETKKYFLWIFFSRLYDILFMIFFVYYFLFAFLVLF